MRSKSNFISVLGLLILSQFSLAQTFSSGESQTPLLELYTSEGCSSCPPADRWLSKLKDDPGLWTDVVPVAFHVDYWNQLGWRDRFSKPSFSERQRAYRLSGGINAVYTPGFVLAGEEWRGWFARDALPEANDVVGELSLTVSDNTFAANFVPAKSLEDPLELHIALLGMDLSTQVKRGENHGRLLRHDFVVLEHFSFSETESRTGAHAWRYEFPSTEPVSNREGQLAVAAWVSKTGSMTPLQAVGGYLKTTSLTSNILRH